ncbi:MAG: amidotransferase [Gemmatimonadetes bacterium]|nr:amidotransferase [Gemmatimonadota bacterium]
MSRSPTIHVLQHDPAEGPGGVAEWAAARGIPLRAAHLYRGDAAPAPAADDWLVVLGGGMSANDGAAHPWLHAERALIRESVDAGRRVLGICLGSQLLAQVLGAGVTRNAETEIGWLPVRKTAEGRGVALFAGFADPAEVFHWHGDTFDTPPGAIRVAGSDGCANQAFVHGTRVVGVQFHPEMTQATARALVAAEGCGWVDGGRFVQPAAEVLRDEGRFGRMRGWLGSLLDALAAAPGG